MGYNILIMFNTNHITCFFHLIEAIGSDEQITLDKRIIIIIIIRIRTLLNCEMKRLRRIRIKCNFVAFQY